MEHAFSNRERAEVYGITTDPSQPLEPLCEALKIEWPPKMLQLLAFKEEKVLEVWVAGKAGAFQKLITYEILAASGVSGPKRMQGDMQVPEGFYRLTDLNPNSRYHLSVRVDYPNKTDIENSKLSRDQMGGDIMLHGNSVSAGCIAIGDEAIERLYRLIELVPRHARRIWIAPVDFRFRPGFQVRDEESWVNDLYQELEIKLKHFRISASQSSSATLRES